MSHFETYYSKPKCVTPMYGNRNGKKQETK